MNMPPQAPPPPQQPNQWSPLKIGLVVGGIMLFSLVSTCGVAAYRGYSAYKEVKQNLADGGMALASPSEVTAQLSGAKRDYVGSWTSTSGKSSLTILENGHMEYHLRDRAKQEDVTVPIAKFDGNDIECHFGIRITLRVTAPPHKVGDKFEMVVDGVTFTRPASAAAPTGS